MNYVLALLAFSAIMIVLATLVTVVVSFIQTIGSMRAKSFNVMLTQLFDKEIAPRIKQMDIESKAEDFVAGITTNPAVVKAEGWLDKLPFFNGDFDELNTRQFIEQFSDTEAGKKLRAKVGATTDEAVTQVISDISYQFERYGEATRIYFEKRAMLISVVVSLLFAFTLNIDAIRLFDELAKDEDLAQSIVDQVDVDALKEDYATAQKLAGSDSTDEELANQFESLYGSVKGQLVTVTNAGLPVGHDYYPYCASARTLAENGGSKTAIKDDRCLSVFEEVSADVGAKGDSAKFRIVEWFQLFFKGTVGVFTTQEGLTWLFRALLSGALIGLGAPFWFKAYKFAAQFVPQRSAPAEHSTQQRQPASNESTVAPQSGGVSGAKQSGAPGLTENDLTNIFMSGKK